MLLNVLIGQLIRPSPPFLNLRNCLVRIAPSRRVVEVNFRANHSIQDKLFKGSHSKVNNSWNSVNESTPAFRFGAFTALSFISRSKSPRFSLTKAWNIPHLRPSRWL